MMKNYFYFLMAILFFGCAKDELIFENHDEIFKESNTDQTLAQYRESDFNFVLRAVHPSRNIDIEFYDGTGKARFQSTIQVWNNGKVRGHASIKSRNRGWDMKAKSAIIRCDNGLQVIEVEMEVSVDSRTRDKEHKEWIVILSTSNSDTDNPDCVIWEIKDSDGNTQAEAMPEGKIFIANSRCR